MGSGRFGATDENSEGNFEWVTGEAFSYSAPATFDNQGYEDYVTVWRFGVNDPLQWNDTASNGRSRYLVETVATRSPAVPLIRCTACEAPVLFVCR